MSGKEERMTTSVALRPSTLKMLKDPRLMETKDDRYDDIIRKLIQFYLERRERRSS